MKIKTNDLVHSCMRSKIAYMDHSKISSIFRKPRFYDGSLNKRDAQGYLIYNNRRIYVTYRGTCTPYDMIDNMDIRRKRIFGNIIVHQGYYEQFMSIEEDITNDIREISEEYPVSELIFAGHSLGSHNATICSAYYGDLFKNRYKITCHTFGSTPVGNSDFVNWFTSNVDENVRVETEEDIVPYIPIHSDFHHVPNGIKINQSGKILYEYQIKPYSYIEILQRIIEKDGWQKINNDHSCENYINSLFAISKIL